MFKLMIVDDEANTCEGLKNFIPWLDFGIDKICVASDGYSALNTFNLENPDIILCDIRMPRMDGLDLTRQIIERKPECKIIFLSGYCDIEYLKRAIRYGAIDYIEKPINLSELMNAVKKSVNMLKHHRSKPKYYHEIDAKHDCSEESDIASALLSIENKPVSKKTTEIKIYIRNNFHDRELSLNKIADHVQLSVNYLCNKFKKETGITIINYLIDVRLFESCILLKNSELNICEISNMTGFILPNYFSRLFRTRIGQTPTEYRNSL